MSVPLIYQSRTDTRLYNIKECIMKWYQRAIMDAEKRDDFISWRLTWFVLDVEHDPCDSKRAMRCLEYTLQMSVKDGKAAVVSQF